MKLDFFIAKVSEELTKDELEVLSQEMNTYINKCPPKSIVSVVNEKHLSMEVNLEQYFEQALPQIIGQSKITLKLSGLFGVVPHHHS